MDRPSGRSAAVVLQNTESTSAVSDLRGIERSCARCGGQLRPDRFHFDIQVNVVEDDEPRTHGLAIKRDVPKHVLAAVFAVDVEQANRRIEL